MAKNYLRRPAYVFCKTVKEVERGVDWKKIRHEDRAYGTVYVFVQYLMDKDVGYNGSEPKAKFIELAILLVFRR